jgi:hypothetical protein
VAQAKPQAGKTKRGKQLPHPTARETKMSANTKSTHTMPGGQVEDAGKADDGMVNDSLGTISIADSTGSDETKETGDAKKNNKPTHED